ncbi:MAG: hypothetical protein QM604_02130, partial [Microbacterium sp.]
MLDDALMTRSASRQPVDEPVEEWPPAGPIAKRINWWMWIVFAVVAVFLLDFVLQLIENPRMHWAT